MRVSLSFALLNLLSRINTQSRMRFQMLIAHEEINIGTMAEAA
jgi:hypothetical protein